MHGSASLFSLAYDFLFGPLIFTRLDFANRTPKLINNHLGKILNKVEDRKYLLGCRARLFLQYLK